MLLLRVGERPTTDDALSVDAMKSLADGSKGFWRQHKLGLKGKHEKNSVSLQKA